MLVGALFKMFGLFLNTPCIPVSPSGLWGKSRKISTSVVCVPFEVATVHYLRAELRPLEQIGFFKENVTESISVGSYLDAYTARILRCE